MKLYHTLLAAFAGLLFMTGCGNDEPVGEILPEYDRADSLSVDYLRELGTIRVSIEESAKLYDLLSQKGYSYNSGLMASSGKSASGSMKQAILIGAFGTDINYASMNGQSQDASNYIQSIMKLADQLGIGSAFSEEVLTKLASDDSTVNKANYLTKAYIRAEDQLYSEDRAQIATMMAVGGWIEGVYISSTALKAQPGDADTKMGFWNQVYVYNNVEKMLTAFPDNPDCKSVLDDFKAARGNVNRIVNSQGKFNNEHLGKFNEAIKGLHDKLLN